MKRFVNVKVMVVAVVAFLGCSLSALEARNAWDLFQFGLWSGIGSNQNQVPVSGFRFGLPVCGGSAPVYGVDLGILGAASDEVDGFQFGTCATVSKKVNGLSLGGLANVSVTVNGVQIGLVNVAKDRSFQIGLLNFITDSPLAFFPVINCKF